MKHALWLFALLAVACNEPLDCGEVWNEVSNKAYTRIYTRTGGSLRCLYSFAESDLDPVDTQIECRIRDEGRLVESENLCISTGAVADCYVDGYLLYQGSVTVSVSRDDDMRVVYNLRLQARETFGNVFEGDICEYRAEATPL